MRVRRCTVLFFELREEACFSLASLLAGGAGLSRVSRWLAIAPHLDHEVEVDAAQRELLGDLSPVEWLDTDVLSDHASGDLDLLLREGLVFADEQHTVDRERDDVLRASYWWPLAALIHRQSRWHGIDGVQAMHDNDLVTAERLRQRFGAPPAEVGEHVCTVRRLFLPRAAPNDLDDLLGRRATCRNFDDRSLSRELFAQMLQRVFSAQAQVRVSDDTVFLKKTSPSGGGLHSTEAYLVVQNVEGIAPGLYHYHPVDHALEPLPPPELPLAEFARLALAGQHWFANAPALVVLTPRFARSFWKYRHHAKAYRALVLDSGHLSQTLYLSATELGLGAFVTSAINEVDIERGFGLDPLVEGPLAICGFGWRAPSMETTEFDPAGMVWESRPEP
ncbi:MAG TPA: putative peptide maturation dehydrogenase [Lysobacter sp.]|nr:putative peptide maturation dehydrogenase [Lysobacter sp.]